MHGQLEDKAAPVATHARRVIRNCNGSEDKLGSSLLTMVRHYTNDNSDCPSSSRCRNDPKYKPSCLRTTDPRAEGLFQGVLCKSVLYFHAEDYVLGKDTCLVDSFNNTMNVFHDKRISWSDAQYLVESYVAVCHSNENVDREYSSI